MANPSARRLTKESGTHEMEPIGSQNAVPKTTQLKHNKAKTLEHKPLNANHNSFHTYHLPT